MSLSTITAFDFIQENSDSTPGLFNRIFSQLSDNIGSVNQAGINLAQLSGSTWASIGLQANSSNSDYIRFLDSSGQRSTYRIGSHAGGTADGLNIFDESGNTMIASFSKQSIRFYQNVVGPVFDVGGALADTLNAATFGTGSDSLESRIQSAIDAASNEGVSRVYVPASMYPYSSSSISFIDTIQMVREGGNWAVFDIQAYGAGGARDATQAIQAAINGAGAGGVIYIPASTYTQSSSIQFSADGQRLIGDGDASVLSYSGTTIAHSFNGKQYCGVYDYKLTSSTGSIGIDLTFISHFWKVMRMHVTGFSTAGVRAASVFYGEMGNCDIDTNGIGFYALKEVNGNHIHSTSFRQNLVGIYVSDNTISSNGNTFVGNNVESARASSLYAIQLEGCQSNVFIGNRLEYTVGTTHFFVNSSAAHTASFNEFIGNTLEGTISAFSLGDGVGSSQVVSTYIMGGRGAGTMSIMSDCASTYFHAAPGCYTQTITDTGFGSDVDIDSTTGKTWKKTAASSATGYMLTVGGSGTIINVGTTNTFDVVNASGTAFRIETNGRVRAPLGSLTAAGDSGGLVGATVTMSNVSDTATVRSTGVGTVLFTDGTNRNNAGFIKFYAGGTTYWVPVFTAH